MLALQKRYRALRPLLTSLNEVAYAAIPDEALLPIAEALGLAVLEDGRIQLHREEDADVVQDFIVHQVAINDERIIEWVRDQQPDGSDEHTLAGAMAQAEFRLVQVAEVLPDYGAWVQDATTGETAMVADSALRQLDAPGLVFCAHFLEVDDLILHTGAPLEVLSGALEQIEEDGPELGISMPPGPEQETDFAALVLRCGLAAMAAAHEDAPLTRYERRQLGAWNPRRPLTRSRPAMNGLCPCGSGKRYKACHGRKKRR